MRMDSRGKSPMYYAAKRGDDDILRLLIQSGKEAKQNVFLDSNPLSIAAKRGHLSTVRLLLDSGAAVATGRMMGLVIKLGAKINHHRDVVKLMDKYWEDGYYDWD